MKRKKKKVQGKITLVEPVRIYTGTNIQDDVYIDCFTYVNSNTKIYKGTRIGKFCSIALNVVIGAPEHPTDWMSTSPFQYNRVHFSNKNKLKSFDRSRTYYTIIGNDVWIGANVLIKKGVRIGDGAIIAAGSIVTKDVGDYEIVGGIPAKKIKSRFSEEIIEKMRFFKWWNLPSKNISEIEYNDIEKVIKDLEKLKKSMNRSIDEIKQIEFKTISMSKDGYVIIDFDSIKRILSEKEMMEYAVRKMTKIVFFNILDEEKSGFKIVKSIEKTVLDRTLKKIETFYLNGLYNYEEVEFEIFYIEKLEKYGKYKIYIRTEDNILFKDKIFKNTVFKLK